MAPKGGDGRSEGAGVCALNVPGFGNTSQARGQGKGGPEVGLEELCVCCLHGGLEGTASLWCACQIRCRMSVQNWSRVTLRSRVVPR